MVIIPQLEYQLQAIVISKNECNSLMIKINTLAKRRAILSLITPNMILYDKDLYSLKHIYDLQLESLCKNLLYQANDKGRLNQVFNIKMIRE